jgi:hypothetical protein
MFPLSVSPILAHVPPPPPRQHHRHTSLASLGYTAEDGANGTLRACEAESEQVLQYSVRFCRFEGEMQKHLSQIWR